MKRIQRLLSFMLTLMIVATTVMGGFTISANAAVPSEVKGKTVCQVLGMDGTVYMNWLMQHETDKYYLGTPYRGYDRRNPNGDCNGAYGSLDVKGQAGMNCTGFVWHVLYKATKSSGGNTSIIPALGRTKWLNFYQSNSISRKYFSSKQAMLDSGYLQKGDIIWMYVNGDEKVANDYHHVGIYWGDGHSDVFWHSTDETGTNTTGNVITKVIPKRNQNITYMVLRVGATQMGTIEIQKSSANPGVTNGNAKYSFAGIRYCFYSDKADAQSSTFGDVSTTPSYIGYMELDANGKSLNYTTGSRATLRNLKIGTYYVREFFTSAIKSSCGYVLDSTVFTVNITVNHSRKTPYVLRISEIPKTCFGKIEKSSTKPELTNNNPEYSFAGIRYSFSKSSSDFSPSGNNYIGYVELDENGVGYTENGSRATLRELVPGTYYVKESVIPAGCKYKMDNTVYTMTFTFDNDKNHLLVLRVKDEPEGTSSAKIIKKSSMPEITEDNTCYSLEGAEFTVYKSKADAQSGTDPYTSIITDENGISTISDIGVGTYYVKETKAPTGFKLSEDIKELKIDTIQEEAYTVEFEDQPMLFSPEILLRKQSDEGISIENGFSGAEYTFKFYAGDYSENELDGKEPTKTWTFATDENGVCSFDRASFVGGDNLYEDGEGEIGIPLGTLLIQESKAPTYYKLDDTVFYRRITVDGIADTSHFNVPVSIETRIPLIKITVNKVWNDDSDRDGIRPQTLSVDLLRDGEIIETIELSKANNWSHEFTDIPEGYADIGTEGGYHVYEYDLIESAVKDYDEPESTSLIKGEKPNEYFCTFTNTYTPERTAVSGDKKWKDFEDLMKFRPSAIIVYLLRDGKKIAEQTVTKDNNWHFEFTNLYKYHDGGKKYVYTFDEKAVDGYEKTINGNTIINELITGSLTIRKTDAKGNPLEGVEFRIVCTDLDSKPVISTFSNGKYHFDGYEEKEGGYKVYKTDKDGLAVVDNLPSGHYEIKEISTADGYMPYTDSIPVTIDDDSEETLDVLTDVENDKLILMDTGGAGTMMLYVIAFAMAGTAMLLCFFFIKKSNKSNLTKRKD